MKTPHAVRVKEHNDCERDALLKRARRLLVELEELNEEVVGLGVEVPDYWKSSDVDRTSIELRVAAACMTRFLDNVLQVGRWKEIMAPGATWASVKADIQKAEGLLKKR